MFELELLILPLFTIWPFKGVKYFLLPLFTIYVFHIFSELLIILVMKCFQLLKSLLRLKGFDCWEMTSLIKSLWFWKPLWLKWVELLKSLLGLIHFDCWKTKYWIGVLWILTCTLIGAFWILRITLIDWSTSFWKALWLKNFDFVYWRLIHLGRLNLSWVILVCWLVFECFLGTFILLKVLLSGRLDIWCHLNPSWRFDCWHDYYIDRRICNVIVFQLLG